MDWNRIDWPLVHIALNHFPLILTVIGTLGAILGSARDKRGVWLYSTISLALAAIFAIPTFITGRLAEAMLKRPWWVAPGAVHAHEDAALIATVVVAVAGLVAALAWRRLIRYPRELALPGALRSLVLVTSLAATGAMGYAALLGGRIVHGAPVLEGPAPSGLAQPPVGLPKETPSAFPQP